MSVWGQWRGLERRFFDLLEALVWLSFYPWNDM